MVNKFMASPRYGLSGGGVSVDQIGAVRVLLFTVTYRDTPVVLEMGGVVASWAAMFREAGLDGSAPLRRSSLQSASR